jgi:RNA polymerase sigma-70 factor (ECF subfamily)
MARMNMNDLLSIIRKLSPGYRLIFNMYAIEGFSHKVIAKELGISEGTSKSQLARARAILQENILKMEGK